MQIFTVIQERKGRSCHPPSPNPNPNEVPAAEMSYTTTSGVRIAQLIGVGASGYLAGTTMRVAHPPNAP